jgi:3-deoxy-7-phosphoheptulonate synthase
VRTATTFDPRLPVLRPPDRGAGMPSSVAVEDVLALRSALAGVAAGRAEVVQAVDCAGGGARSVGLLDELARTMELRTRRPVVRIGRDPDPGRSVDCPPVWTSRDALMGWSESMVRSDGAGGSYLASSHWPCGGDLDVEGAQVALLASVVNPVACVVGPRTSAAEVVALCERLDPGRDPGRLTFVARMGASVVAERLPPLVRAVAAAGHPVIWVTDPLGGNSVVAPGGVRTRFVVDVVREVLLFQDAVRVGGGVPGGIRLECTPDDVAECVQDRWLISRVSDNYTTPCDPRLAPGQAVAVVGVWRAEVAR